jgi:cobyrinic acid a,c-diamide synthase
VLFNQVGSPTHLKYLKDALSSSACTPCLGGVIRNGDIAIPERHLGLVTAEDHELTPQRMNILADCVENAMDLDALLDGLPEIAPVRFAKLSHGTSKVRLAVARDQAFCFYYPENLEMLEESGSEIVRFSLLNDIGFPENIDGIYLGGGYPELHAAVISENVRLKNQILEKCREGMPIYGECGGFMVLCKTLVDLDGNAYPMIGCFDFTCRMTSSLKALGYREMTLMRKTILGEAGVTVRGHEFHYSQLDSHELETVYQTHDLSGSPRNVKGFQVNRCLGSYLHLHFKSQPSVPRAFVQECLEYHWERTTMNAAP